MLVRSKKKKKWSCRHRWAWKPAWQCDRRRRRSSGRVSPMGLEAGMAIEEKIEVVVSLPLGLEAGMAVRSKKR